MDRYFKILLLVLLVLFCFAISYYCVDINNNRLRIELVDCIDGDTAKFIINGKKEKVRFLGIDTPESTNFIEEYGKDASDYTCNMLKNSNNIYIEYDSNSDSRDKYNRVLGYIFVDNNNLSELLLSKGYAEVKYIYGDYKYIDRLCKAEYNAYKNNLGIWSTNDYKYQDGYCYKNRYMEK